MRGRFDAWSGIMTKESAQSPESARRRIKEQMQEIREGRLTAEEEWELKQELSEDPADFDYDYFLLRSALRRCFRDEA